MKKALFLCLMLSVLLATFSSTAALATKPSTTCPAEQSGFVIVNRDGWWDRTVQGFEFEGIDVYDSSGNFTPDFDAFATTFDFENGEALETFVRVHQWAQIDKNGNDYVCMKDPPNTPGIPDFFFTGLDDNASTKKGQKADS